MFFFPIKKQLEFACEKCSDFAPSYYPIQRLLFKFTSPDLIEHLRENPEICQNILMMNDDKRYSPATTIISTQNKFIVALIPHNIRYLQRVQSFGKIEEALADYVLWNWKMPRLRPTDTEKTLRSPNSIDFYDENGNIFDKLKGRFKYYDAAEKKFVYYD